MSMKQNQFQPTRPVPLNAQNMYFQQNSFGYSPVGSYSFTNQQHLCSPAFILTPMDTPMIEDCSEEMKDDNNLDQEMFVFDEQMERQNQMKCMNHFNSHNCNHSNHSMNCNNFNNCNNCNTFNSQGNNGNNCCFNCNCNSFNNNNNFNNSNGFNMNNCNNSNNYNNNCNQYNNYNNYCNNNSYTNSFINNNTTQNQTHQMNGYKQSSRISTHTINHSQSFNQPNNSPMTNGNIIQNNTQYDPNRFNRGGNTNYFTHIPTPQYNQYNQFQRSMSSQLQTTTIPSSNPMNSNGNTFSNTNDSGFHYLSNNQNQPFSMPRNGIQNIQQMHSLQSLENVRETPISVRDFGVDDEFDQYRESEEYDDFEDEDCDEDDYVNDADEIFQEVIETVQELRKIGDQNNQLLSNMIKSQK